MVNDRLVLQLVSGLTEPYNGVATLIRQSDPFPQFYQARSMLVLKEAGLKKTSQNTSSAMVAHDSDNSHDSVDQLPSRCHNAGGRRPQSCGHSGKNRNSSGGRGKGNFSGGSGSGGKGGGNNNRNGVQQQPPTNQWTSGQQWM
ncbi:hyphally regulated cell wall protein 1-like [Solanum dulcamara]|uniref:hyphally regulated cell wall protein 1-like n=1 Tax=Solanum dulcamara TaxID=45834 RepID=UPI0024852710|nr:hyphally regulated cell wall protein 1-like [Solanum dulcamara]